MGLNAFLTIGILTAIAAGVIIFFSKTKKAEEREARLTSMEKLSAAVVEYVNEYTSANLLGLNLSRNEYLKQEQHRREVAMKVHNCCNGNEGTRDATKALIEQYIESEVPADVINGIFDLSSNAPVTRLFEAVLYRMDNGGQTGFMEFLKKVDYKSGRITEEDVRKLFKSLSLRFSDDDRRKLVVQEIYAAKFGLGCIDTLNYQRGVIEEIEIGLSGPRAEAIRYRDRLTDDNEDIRYNKDSVHVVIRGECIAMEFLSFGTDDELLRVQTNLIKCCDCGELTQIEPYKVTDTIDGRRVTVARPGASDARFGNIRKFDTVKIVELNALFNTVPDYETAVRVIRKCIWSGGNIAVLGEMGSGKTTTLRAIMRELPADKSIRTVEAESFELNLRHYLPGRNVAAIRTNDFLSEADAFSLLKKTSGHRMAVGEITTMDVANTYLNLCTVAPQCFTTAHHKNAVELISDLANARLAHGYTSERLAETDAVKCVDFVLRIEVHGGVRYISRIEQVVYDDDLEKTFELSHADGLSGVREGIENVRRQLGKIHVYKIIPIIEYDYEENRYRILGDISDDMNRAYINERKEYGLYADTDITRPLPADFTDAEKSETDKNPYEVSPDVSVFPEDDGLFKRYRVSL